MRVRFSDLWRWDGTVDRGPYLLIGVVLFALKHNIDRFVASAVFGRPWSLFNYVFPSGSSNVADLQTGDRDFYSTLLAIAIPFIYVGVVLTIRRLRAAGLSPWLVVLFFLPVVNLLFFAVLAAIPSTPDPDATLRTSGKFQAFLDRFVPDSGLGSAAMALGLTTPLALCGILLGVNFFERYGWSLFVGLPFCMGLYSVLLYGYHRHRSFVSCLAVSCVAVTLLGLALAALAIEGAICLAMAAPIMLVLAVLGGSVGYLVQRRPGGSRHASAALLVLVVAAPALMGAESQSSSEPPLIAVVTSIEIDAPSDVVWHNVVSFTELPPPAGWLFETGIAYPLRADIRGRGVGAVRECVFSTGPFVEPITVWDRPRLLRFSVTQQPPAMRELTLYADAHPPHLDNYLASEGGQFLLTPFDGGRRTQLEGTTWYRNRMWPSPYWQVWSDAIIHRIHTRVLEHVKALSESPPQFTP